MPYGPAPMASGRRPLLRSRFSPPEGRSARRPCGGPSRVVFGEEFVLEQVAVVMDDLVLDAAVLVLVDDDAAAAGVVPVVRDWVLRVLALALLDVLRVHGLPARGTALLRAGGGGKHRLSSWRSNGCWNDA